MVKTLQGYGWVVAYIHDSRHILNRDRTTVALPVHGTRDSGAGHLRKIEKATGFDLVMNLEYPYTLEPQEGGGFLVQFLDSEEAVTAGKTLEEARFNAREVLTAGVARRIEDDMDTTLPPEKDMGLHAAPDAAARSARLAHIARQESGGTLADLAGALGTSGPAVKRLENPRHTPTPHRLEQVAATLGKRPLLQKQSPDRLIRGRPFSSGRAHCGGIRHDADPPPAGQRRCRPRRRLPSATPARAGPRSGPSRKAALSRLLPPETSSRR